MKTIKIGNYRIIPRIRGRYNGIRIEVEIIKWSPTAIAPITITTYIEDVEKPSWLERKLTKNKTIEDKVLEEMSDIMRQAIKLAESEIEKDKILQKLRERIEENAYELHD